MPWARGESDGSPIGGGAQRIELRGEVPVAADRLGEVGGADDDARVDRVPRRGGAAAGRGVDRRRPGLEHLAGRRVDRRGILPVALVELENVRRR